MSLIEKIRNIPYLFKLLGQLWHTWFLPYHYNHDDEEEEKEEAEEAEEDHAPDRSPQPVPPPPAEAVPHDETAVATEETPTKPRLCQVMAFRGPSTKMALAAMLGEDVDRVGPEVDTLVETQMIEDLGDSHYLLTSSERSLALRSDSQVADWLSRLAHPDFENDALNLIDRLGRELALKITPGQSLVFHLRQRKWMVWQSQEATCRVRLFGTLSKQQWTELRQLDERVKGFRRREPHRWDSRDWVAFRWRAGADTGTIESLLLDLGREFQKQVRHRRSGKGRPSAQGAAAELPAESSSETAEESELEPQPEAETELSTPDYPQDRPRDYPLD